MAPSQRRDPCHYQVVVVGCSLGDRPVAMKQVQLCNCLRTGIIQPYSLICRAGRDLRQLDAAPHGFDSRACARRATDQRLLESVVCCFTESVRRLLRR